MKSKFNHVIWDWNGTLLNDTHLNYQAVCKVLELKGQKPITFEFFQTKLRFPLTGFYEDIGLLSDDYDFRQLELDFYKVYDHRVYDEASLHNGVDTLLDQLSSNNTTQSVLSARQHDSLVKEVAYFQIDHHFEKVRGAQPGMSYQGKLHYAEEILHDHPNEEVVIIGDTVHDYEIAQSLSINCVLVAQGLASKEVLLDTDAPVLDTHTELKEHLFDE